MTESGAKVVCKHDAVELTWACGSHSTLPHLWLRDNCGCDDCRISQTTEKKFILSDVPADLAPSEVDLSDDTLRIVWPDAHVTTYEGESLRTAGQSRMSDWSPWPQQYVPGRYPYRAFLDDDRVAADAISVFMDQGAFILSEAPDVPGTLEELATRLGPIREVLFDRIHDVKVDPGGYNVAHTPLALPPHNDFASYTWPPSVQALHMLVNEATGGKSIIVDGWSVLESLRDDHPESFDALCTMPVPFREFDEDNETYAEAPMVRLDAGGRINGLRFSNQLMQTIDPNDPGTPGFYRAYHELCRRVTDPQNRSVFLLEGGEILIVAAHRVLHGREAFEATGPRHLQDAYFELDNVRNHLFVLRRAGVS
jgi:gamma-butyrobetaine dioxygenase